MSWWFGVASLRQMEGQIFISYRRDESQAWAGRISDRLDSQLGSDHIFLDVDNIDPGADFIDAIKKSVGACDALIAVIGRNWLISADKEGRRRLDNPEDFVRVEIATALKRGVGVIPVLVDGALELRPGDLPDDLKALARRQALKIRHDRFDDDCRQLITALERLLERVKVEKRPVVQKSKIRRLLAIGAGLVTLAVAFLLTLKWQPKPPDDAYAPATATPGASVTPIPSTPESMPTVASTPVIASSARIESAKTLPASVGSTTAATKEIPFVNGLGMRFVPVPGTNVLFSVWETRVKDYQAFCDATNKPWTKPRFLQTGDHPAVNVTWEYAKTFCEWLSEKEGKSYRLPTDHEWSCAVEIGDREDSSAEPWMKDGKVRDVFPWGEQWPPPNDAGNYSGEECKTTAGLAELKASGIDASSWLVIKGFNDEKVFTAPVGSFPPNGLGIYDLGGNVWEWCADKSNLPDSRVLRGGSWYYVPDLYVLSSSRGRWGRYDRGVSIGFRIVVEAGSKR